MGSAWALTPCRGPGGWAGYSSLPSHPSPISPVLSSLPASCQPEEQMKAFLLLLQGLPLSPFIWPTLAFAHGA